MAVKGWLSEFDYLSSVSGGGYIHSWFAAWLLRKTRELKDPRAAWQQVMKRLHPLANGDPRFNQFVWPRQIQWLRRYSNYLTPRKGLLSGDTWAAFAVGLRNVLLNQALLLTIFLFLLYVPHALAPDSKLLPLAADDVKASSVSSLTIGHTQTKLTLQLTSQFGNHDDDSHFSERFKDYVQPNKPFRWPGRRNFQPSSPWTWTALASYVVGCLIIGFLLRLEYRGASPGSSENALPPRSGGGLIARARRHEFWIVLGGVIAPLFLFGFSLTFLVVSHPPFYLWTIKVFVALLILIWIETFAGGALSNSVAQEQDAQEAADPGVPHKVGAGYTFGVAVGLLALGIPAAATGAGLAAAIAALLWSGWITNAQQWLLLNQAWPVQLTAGTLLFFWVAPLTMVVASGMIGKLFPGWMSEWLGRIRGYTLITGVGWIGFCGGALLLPGVAVRVASVHWFAWSSVGAWVATTASGVLSGKSGKTSGEQNGSSGVLNLIAVVAPYVYILGLLVLLSWLTDVASLHYPVVGQYGWLKAMVVLFLLGFLLQWRLDINQFSMHTFYRNRLTRCYLGASNPVRNPSPVTGFDERDSSVLCVHQFTPEHYPGPIPIFSCTINITTGEDLAWQERKAASFAFTPFYSGYTVGWTGVDEKVRFNGFVPTSMLYPQGPTVATAVAASGAAISPNWGYHTNPATAFLLTMFDARLGLWVPNPRRSEVAGRKAVRAKVPAASPRFAIVPLTKELLGSVGDASNYVYVTDGGHFDNSGLYELVRRRCYRIVICDAEEDGDYVFEGIGMAIRKCRIDFGVEIDLNLTDLVPNSESALSPGHVITGSIRYPETPGDDERGTITYIKSSLTGKVEPPAPFWRRQKPAAKGTVELPDVPGDVQNYKLQHADFPHDSTAEQWFTESQFESYRRLGQKIVEGMPDPFQAGGAPN
jgi:hypothetical protein